MHVLINIELKVTRTYSSECVFNLLHSHYVRDYLEPESFSPRKKNIHTICLCNSYTVTVEILAEDRRCRRRAPARRFLNVRGM